MGTSRWSLGCFEGRALFEIGSAWFSNVLTRTDADVLYHCDGGPYNSDEKESNI
jgi:hypothetical protein